MNKIKVLIVEDEPLIAHDIAATLQGINYETIGPAYSVEKAHHWLNLAHPDIVLLDINLGTETDGISLAEALRDRYDIPFIYLTSYADRNTLERAKRTLPMGYLVKPYSEKDLFAVLEVALFNFVHLRHPVSFNLEKFNAQRVSKLTPKEFEILQDLYEGKTNSQLAEKHFISANTVKTHIKHLYEKLEVQSRTDLMILLRNQLDHA
jgi:two-component system, response regulator PdtaR